MMNVQVHADTQVKGLIELFDGLLGKHDSERPIPLYLLRTPFPMNVIRNQ